LTGTTAATAYNGNPCPPQSIDLVGIGTNTPIAKLHVEKTLPGGAAEAAIYARQGVGAANAYGADVIAGGASGSNFGVRGTAVNGARNYGLYGSATLVANTNYGVQGDASNASGNIGVLGNAIGGATTIGVRASASGGSGTNTGIHASASGANALAGLFDGDVVINGGDLTVNGIFYPSDAAFKTNVAPIPSTAATQLMQLDALSYQYLPSAAPQADLPSGDQTGFMAQQVEQLFPQLVRDFQFPAVFDSSGAIIHPAVPVKAINYTGMIPYLVAALQEQNTRIDQLQQQLDQCCNAGGGIGVDRSMDAGTVGTGLGRETDLRIIPNPVAPSTQLRYTVATEGRVRLEVSDAMGRMVEVLEEGQRTAGEFIYQWNTSRLAPGTYYCTLLVNDEPLVKRAVKLNDR
jgi:hypothetical protein